MGALLFVASTLAVASVALTSQVAQAGARKADETRVAVMPLMVEGDVESEVQGRINDQIREALESETYTVVPGRPPGGTCRDYRCIHSVAKDADAQYVVVGSIATVERDYGIAVFVYDFSGKLKAKEEATCEICSYDEAGDALAAKVEALKPELESLVENPYGEREKEHDDSEGPGTFIIRTDPPGAVVKIDGKRRGTTPLTIEVEPGLRELEVSARNHATLTKTVRAIRSERINMEYSLVESDERQTKALRATGITFSILGVGLLGAGIPLLAIDESPVKNDCEGTNVDFEGTCRYRYNTLLPGALLTATGAAALVTGLATGLVAFGRRNKVDKSNIDDLDEDTISVTPVFGPTSVGLRGRF